MSKSVFYFAGQDLKKVRSRMEKKSTGQKLAFLALVAYAYVAIGHTVILYGVILAYVGYLMHRARLHQAIEAARKSDPDQDN